MTIYAVLAPPVRAGSARPDPDDFVFVKEGLCWPALFVPLVWLVWRKMWLVLVGYVAASLALMAVAEVLPPPVAATMLILFAFLVALEANNLRRWTLERHGYQFLGVAEGPWLSDAEYRFFAGWTAGPLSSDTARSTGARQPATSKPAPPTPATGQDIVGLFPATEVRT